MRIRSRPAAWKFAGVAGLVLGLCHVTPIEAQSAEIQAQADTSALVVLVHGMGRTSFSMLPLELALEREGYRVLNFSYSSYGPSVAEIAAELRARLDAEGSKRPPSRIHFVGHSLGNIIVRWMLLNDRPASPIGRMVMLAPPNQGSRAADLYAPLFGWLLRPLAELQPEGGTAAELPPPKNLEFAIVAGKSDGKVSVAETCLAGATAHVVVPSSHTFILMRPDVFGFVRQFLRDGTATAELERAPDCSSGTVSNRAPLDRGPTARNS